MLKDQSEKFGGKIKDKFSKMFANEEKVLVKEKEKSSPLRQTLNVKETSKKDMFSIHDDEEHKIYNYNDDMDDEYEDDDEDDEESLPSPRNSHLEKKKSDCSDKSPIIRKNSIEKKLEKSLSISSFEELENVDPHTIIHRIYQSDSIIDTDGLIHVKCYRVKSKSGVLSLIGVK